MTTTLASVTGKYTRTRLRASTHMEYLLVLKWLLVLAALSAVGAPLAALAFPRLPRRGAPFALPAALLPLALVVFWIGQVSFGLHAVLAALAAVVALSAAAYRAGARPDWEAVAWAYGVFALGFLLLVVYRAYNPGITPAGGEQFLHFGVTKSILRAGTLPPEDFWFAGEPLRYYYGTQMQVTVLSMLTSTDLRYGFNLGPAVFYGVLFVSAYGVAGSITALRGRSYRLGGTLGAFFVALGGALTTAVRLAFGLLPEDLAIEYGRPAFGAIRHMDYREAVLTQSDPMQWFWFYDRYVVPDTLQEFPMYSFVKGDLHGHGLSTAFVVVAAGLALSYYLLPADRRRQRLGVLFGGLGLVAGVFGFMNTWSLPTAVGLAWLAVAAADAHPATLLPGGIADRLVLRDADADEGDAADDGLRRLAAEAWRIVLAAVPAALVGVVGVALASPFLVFGAVPTNDGIGLFPPRTDLAPFLVIYGGLLALFAGYVLARGWPAARDAPRSVQAGVALVGLAAVAVLVSVLSFPVLAVTGPILLAAWWLVRTDRAGFEAVLLVAGVGLILSMDLVYAKVWPPQQTRWNTTLKVAVQGWTLAGVAAGATAALLWADARETLTAARERAESSATASSDASADGGRPGSVPAAALAALLVVAVVATSAPFAALAFGHGVGADLGESHVDPTLDGLDVHDRWKAPQMEAIYWLDDREGTPTVLEAPGRDAYRWTSPASTMTGLPTVVGWTHQQGYRGIEPFERRAAQVDRVYTEPLSESAGVLRAYDVEYVYVGPNERERYEGLLRTFDHEAFSVAFENGEVAIYEVDHSALPAGNGTVVADVAPEAR